MNKTTGRSYYSIGFAYGVLGAFIFTILLAALRWAGLTQFNMSLFLGSMLTLDFTLTTWTVGFIWHLINGGIFGLAYGAIFKNSGGAGAGRGVLLGFVHWLAFAVIMAVAPSFHPLIPSEIVEPGFFGINLGALSAFSFLGIHLIYGYVVGNGLEKKMPKRRRQVFRPRSRYA